jgi:SAM-dependent methyltransferase
MKPKIDVTAFNKNAWNKEVEKKNEWTIPVSPEEIAEARLGNFKILLTPTKPVPAEWFPPLKNLKVLCLASGGGQQGPLLAAAGAQVTVFDNSPSQLDQDRLVAKRENLGIRTVEGDMVDLSVFPDSSFDLIVHPISNCFIPKIRPVWKEAFRVLRSGGTLISGFCNPIRDSFDWELFDKGIYQVRYPVPYSDLTSLSEEERIKRMASNEPLEFGHSLEDQIGGQLDAGFLLTGFYEDVWEFEEISKYMPLFIATRALKPHHN